MGGEREQERGKTYRPFTVLCAERRRQEVRKGRRPSPGLVWEGGGSWDSLPHTNLVPPPPPSSAPWTAPRHTRDSAPNAISSPSVRNVAHSAARKRYDIALSRPVGPEAQGPFQGGPGFCMRQQTAAARQTRHWGHYHKERSKFRQTEEGFCQCCRGGIFIRV